jgi:hypothetical protein
MSAVTEAPARLSTAAKLRLTAEILAAYVRTRRLMRGAGLKEALADLRGVGPGPQPAPGEGDVHEGIRLGRAVARVLGPLPLESACLTRSLVLTRLLSQRDIPSRLVIGVRPGEEFGAHAWVELDGQPVLPPGGDEFSRLVDL